MPFKSWTLLNIMVVQRSVLHPFLNVEFMVQLEQSFTAVTHLCSFIPHMQRTNIYRVTGTPNESPFICLVACFIRLQKLDFSGWNRQTVQYSFGLQFTQELFSLRRLLNTVGLGYNNLSLCNTLGLMVYIYWYQLIPHKACVFCLAQYCVHKSIYLKYNKIGSPHFNIVLQEVAVLRILMFPHP